MNAETMATVLRLACLTEDRDPTEQQAMLEAALHVDQTRGRFVMSNRRPRSPEMVALVEVTYDPSEGRRITLTKGQRAQYDRLRAKWQRCDECKQPMGAHYAEGCPTTPNDLAWLARLT